MKWRFGEGEWQTIPLTDESAEKVMAKLPLELRMTDIKLECDTEAIFSLHQYRMGELPSYCMGKEIIRISSAAP